MQAPSAGATTWCALSDEPLDAAAVHAWLVRPDCGAVVAFVGTVREFADGRDGVTALAYEAYEEQVVPRLEAIAAEIRTRFVDVGNVVLLHRIGELALEDAAVIVGVSSAHRPAAFDAARFGIDALKGTVPIWKRERWSDGEGWGTRAIPVAESVDEAAARPAP